MTDGEAEVTQSVAAQKQRWVEGVDVNVGGFTKSWPVSFCNALSSNKESPLLDALLPCSREESPHYMHDRQRGRSDAIRGSTEAALGGGRRRERWRVHNDGTARADGRSTRKSVPFYA